MVEFQTFCHRWLVELTPQGLLGEGEVEGEEGEGGRVDGWTARAWRQRRTQRTHSTLRGQRESILDETVEEVP